ncbi:MAG: hypothetical protein AAFQ66_15960 [Pseudomonadota bacterium]
MGIKYDVDMFSVVPDSVQLMLMPYLDKLHTTAQMSRKRAMFRDEQAIEALLRADQVVRDFLTASGVSLDVHDSGAPSGYYPSNEEEDRLTIAEQLAYNLDQFDLKGANWGGFDLYAFADALLYAEPMDDADLFAYRFGVATSQSRGNSQNRPRFVARFDDLPAAAAASGSA